MKKVIEKQNTTGNKGQVKGKQSLLLFPSALVS